MDRSFNLVYVNFPDSVSPKRERPIDWSLCVLCQKISNEELVNPAQNKRQKKNYGYETLDRNLKAFQHLGRIPCNANVEVLSDGPGIRKNLEDNSAVYHKSCYLKCTDSKLSKVRKSDEENVPPYPLPTRRSLGCTVSDNEDTCIFCGSGETHTCPLQEINPEIGGKAQQALAVTKCDSKILVALLKKNPKCHKKCRAAYMYEKQKVQAEQKSEAHKISLTSVVETISKTKENGHDRPVFAVSQLARKYSEELQKQGIETVSHSSRLKDRILRECPYLEVSGSPGQKALLRFKDDVDATVRNQCATVDKSAIAQAAKEVRQDIFSHVPSDWRENCAAASVNSSVPESLRKLVTLILDGQEDSEDDTVVSTIAQLLYFHSRKRTRAQRRRNDARKETPVPVYLAMKLYGETRKKELVDITYRLGLSISYDRLQSILTEKANRACQQYTSDRVVCPLSLQIGAFTTAAVDNIDHNTSAMFSKDAFHGTAISLMQHGPPGAPRNVTVEGVKQRKLMELPAEYVVVPPCFLEGKDARCLTSHATRVELNTSTDPGLQESDWLNSCRQSVTMDTWASHHAKADHRGDHKTRFAILPVFREKSHSIAMMAHSMNIAMKSIQLLNPSQIPVIVADQPLYTLCKQLQWLQPNVYGEQKIFVILGGLHIEMAAVRVMGDWLEGSGWTNALTAAGVTTSGRAESTLVASHLTRARYAHQVTAVVLYTLKMEAFESYDGDVPLTFEQWCCEKRAVPQFRFWDIALKMELIVLQIVRALRSADFELYNDALSRIVPFFFALDHQNYARWLPVYIRDNLNLKSEHPSLWEQFMAGYFVADKCGRPFSRIALDQAHEQINAILKGNGGMIGLTEDPAALLKWMICAPEVAEFTVTFENHTFYADDDHPQFLHHLDSASARSRFQQDITALKKFFENAGNPFAEEGCELYNIDSKKCCDAKVVDTVMTVESLGFEQYCKFSEERLQTGRVPIHATLSKNQLPTFARTPKTSAPTSKAKQQIKSLKTSVNVYSRMWIAGNKRVRDLDTYFSYENQEFPPALSNSDGYMRSTNKADLVNLCLAPLMSSQQQSAPVVDVKILDGAALPHQLRPGVCVLFADYREKVFLPFVQNECANVTRMDIVWDTYIEGSLKGMTREKRGEGQRLLVTPSTNIPKDWRGFLRNSENKRQLFDLLAEGIPSCPTDGTQLYSTRGESVLSNCAQANLQNMAPCNHEEADTRIFLHVSDAVSQGLKKVMIRASDTDIVVLACAVFNELPGLVELWIYRPTSKDYKYIAVHELCETLGPEKSRALPSFHAFTGCDTVDAFYKIGKKSAWDALVLQPEAVEALQKLSTGKVHEIEEKLHKFVISMYSPSKMYTSVTKCRKSLFSSGGRAEDSIPPTGNSLEQHSLRASFQAIIWSQCLKREQEMPNPQDFGWHQKCTGSLVPLWMTQPPSATDAQPMTRCGCKVACRGNCKCKHIGCCDLCKCPCND